VNLGSVFEQTISQMFGVNAMVFAMAVIGLNVHFGYTGLLNFGQIGFVAMGGYGLGMSITIFGWNPWLGLLVGLLYALLFALLLGIPTLRLRGDYLAIVTIAASEVLRILVRSTTVAEWTGGNTGLTGDGTHARTRRLRRAAGDRQWFSGSRVRSAGARQHRARRR